MSLCLNLLLFCGFTLLLLIWFQFQYFHAIKLGSGKKKSFSEVEPVLAAASVWSLFHSLAAQFCWVLGREHQLRSWFSPSSQVCILYYTYTSELFSWELSFFPFGPSEQLFSASWKVPLLVKWLCVPWVTLCFMPLMHLGPIPRSDIIQGAVMAVTWSMDPSPHASLGLIVGSTGLAWEIHILPQNTEDWRRGYVTYFLWI